MADDRPAPARGADRRGPLPDRGGAGARRRSGRYLDRHPTAFAQWLCALELAHAGSTEVAIVGEPGDDGDRGRCVAVVDRGYHPFRVQASSRGARTARRCRCSRGRFALDGRPTAFVCHDFACRLPVHRARGARGAPCRRLRPGCGRVVGRRGPAATVVLVMRPGPRGLEVLLTRRPSTMAFGPGLHVFPGGAVDPSDARRPAAIRYAAAAVRELVEEVGIRVALDALVPLSRWVTPPGSSRRYDTRFFVAGLPAGAEVVADPREVADHRWITPARRPGRDGRGAIDLWPPTSTTLQQLAPARDLDDVRRHLAPVAAPRPLPSIEPCRRPSPGVTFGGAGAIPGQTVDGYLVGRRRVVVVDPGDPSDEAADAIARVLRRAPGASSPRSCSPRRCRITRPARRRSRSATRSRSSPRPARARSCRATSSRSRTRDVLGFADVEIRVHATPGTHADHLAFSLPARGRRPGRRPVGPGPSRAIPEPVDEAALSRSRALVEGLAGSDGSRRTGRAPAGGSGRLACRPSRRRRRRVRLAAGHVGLDLVHLLARLLDALPEGLAQRRQRLGAAPDRARRPGRR